MKNLAQSLNAEYSSGATVLEVVDPVIQTPMRLKVADIKLYSGNPRHCLNPKYEEIKDSIRYKGLELPLVVTRVPGETKYTLASGGNTRLQILQELEKEDNVKFEFVNVIFKPWTGENNNLISHLIENELRGEMSFVDTAKSICGLKEQIESELGKSISWREFEKQLKQSGLSFSHSQVSRMRFLTEKLLPLLPEERLSSFGSHHTQIIQSAISEAKKHYTGELDFIDYYECSIKSYFILFKSVETIAETIVSLVQVEPASNVDNTGSAGTTSASIQEPNSGDVPATPGATVSGGQTSVSAPSSNASGEVNTNNVAPEGSTDTSSKEVVQSEPLLDTREPKAHLQQIIVLRGDNYNNALSAVGIAHIYVSDQGVGFLVDDCVLKKPVYKILRDLCVEPYTLKAEALSDLSETERVFIVGIFNNICLQVQCLLLAKISFPLSQLSNDKIREMQNELDV